MAIKVEYITVENLREGQSFLGGTLGPDKRVYFIANSVTTPPAQMIVYEPWTKRAWAEDTPFDFGFDDITATSTELWASSTANTIARYSMTSKIWKSYSVNMNSKQRIFEGPDGRIYVVSSRAGSSYRRVYVHIVHPVLETITSWRASTTFIYWDTPTILDSRYIICTYVAYENPVHKIDIVDQTVTSINSATDNIGVAPTRFPGKVLLGKVYGSSWMTVVDIHTKEHYNLPGIGGTWDYQRSDGIVDPGGWTMVPTTTAIRRIDPDPVNPSEERIQLDAGTGNTSRLVSTGSEVLIFLNEPQVIARIYDTEWTQPSIEVPHLTYEPNRYYMKATVRFWSEGDYSLVSTSENANVSYPDQVADKNEDITGKILSLDGSCTADGTYIVAGEGVQMGWWGSQLADKNGDFASPPSIKIDCHISTQNEWGRPVLGLRLVGDKARGEYPKEFTVNLYNQVGGLLASYTFQNDSPEFEAHLPEPVDDVWYVEIVVNKWSHPNRQVKIVEIRPKSEFVFDDTRILSATLHEEITQSMASCVIGGVPANEFTLELSNLDEYFNEDKPIGKYLSKGKHMEVKLLALNPDTQQMDEIPLGKFLTEEWDIQEEEYKVILRARDYTSQLENQTFSVAPGLTKDLHTLLQETLSVLGGCVIPDSLPNWNIVITKDMYGINKRTAVQKIVEALGGILIMDREGNLYLRPFSWLIGDPDISLTFGELYSKKNVAKDDIINKVEVNVFPEGESTKDITQTYTGFTISAGETKTFTIDIDVPYDKSGAGAASVILVGADSSTTLLGYSFPDEWTLEVKVTASVDDSFDIQVSYTATKLPRVAEDVYSQYEFGERTYTVDNPFIQHRDQAEYVAQQILDYYKVKRPFHELAWRGSPSILPGRVLQIDNVKGVVLESEFKYDPTTDHRVKIRRFE